MQQHGHDIRISIRKNDGAVLLAADRVGEHLLKPLRTEGQDGAVALELAVAAAYRHVCVLFLGEEEKEIVGRIV